MTAHSGNHHGAHGQHPSDGGVMRFASLMTFAIGAVPLTLFFINPATVELQGECKSSWQWVDCWVWVEHAPETDRPHLVSWRSWLIIWDTDNSDCDFDQVDDLFWHVDWILGTGSPQDPCDSTKFRAGLLRVLWVFPKQRFPSHYKSCWGGKLHRSQSPQWSYGWWATTVCEDQECKGLWILVLSLALKFFCVCC